MYPYYLSKIYVAGLLLIAVVFQSTFFCSSSCATLGGTSATIEADRKVAAGMRLQGIEHKLYTTHEVRGQGFSFKEYVSPQGIVFGMTWTGKVPLQLNDIFGSYLADYQQAAENAGKQKKIAKYRVRVAHVFIRGSKVILERFGQGAHAHSRAIVPELMPEGVKANEIQ